MHQGLPYDTHSRFPYCEPLLISDIVGPWRMVRLMEGTIVQMKKLLFLVLAVSGLLMGCNKTEDTGGSTTNTNAPATNK
jgi:hypothetical protein